MDLAVRAQDTVSRDTDGRVEPLVVDCFGVPDTHGHVTGGGRDRREFRTVRLQRRRQFGRVGLSKIAEVSAQ